MKVSGIQGEAMNLTANGITLTDRTGSVSKMVATLPTASILENGDIIIALIERIEGETLKLRTGEGMLLSALMQGDLGLTEGDTLEAMVGKNDERSTLYIMNVSHKDLFTAAENKAQQASPGMLADMLSTLKRNPGMDAEMAIFLNENNIPDTSENISALTQLAHGEGIGALLGHILGSVMQSDDAPQATMSGEVAPQGANADQVQDNAPEREQSATLSQTDAKHSTIVQSPTLDGEMIIIRREGETQETPAAGNTAVLPSAENNISKMDKPTLPEHAVIQNETDVSQNIGMLVKEETVTPKFVQTAVHGPLVKAELPMEARTSAERIVETIRDTTYRFDDRDGAEMKKMSRELPRALSALKSMVVQSDIKDIEACLKRTDQTLRQMELADRTLRFEHMQLPVMDQAGEFQTAELYVFRNRKGRKEEADTAGTSILLALDTRHIGRTETLIREAGGSISLEFRLEQMDAAEMFKSKSAMLTQVVEASGYRLAGVRFAKLERRTTVINAGEAVDLMAGNTPRGVDVRI